MFPDLLNGRSSPFTRVKSFELNMDRPSSSYVIPTNVMAYLFGGSRGFDLVGWEGMKRLYKTSYCFLLALIINAEHLHTDY